MSKITAEMLWEHAVPELTRLEMLNRHLLLSKGNLLSTASGNTQIIYTGLGIGIRVKENGKFSGEWRCTMMSLEGFLSTMKLLPSSLILLDKKGKVLKNQQNTTYSGD